jgi:CheY-like chemotaxis protein
MIQVNEEIPVVETLSVEVIRVLMIDDDEAFSRLVQGVLQRHGCEIVTVNNPVKALEVYTRQKDRIQLVLLDYFMPMLDGGKTLEWLRKLNPEIRVVLCSSSDELRLRQFMIQLPFDGYIHKPLRIQEAVATIRDVMSKPTRRV